MATIKKKQTNKKSLLNNQQLNAEEQDLLESFEQGEWEKGRA